jgi:hypothetical protein
MGSLSAMQALPAGSGWQRGQSMSSIGRVFDRQSSSVFSVISPTGGILAPDRRRGRSALSLSEREEISRGRSIKQSVRAIARRLRRAPSTISREVRRNRGPKGIVRPLRIKRRGIALCVPRCVSWLVTRCWPAQYQQSCGASGHLSRLRAGSNARSRERRTNRCHTH